MNNRSKKVRYHSPLLAILLLHLALALAYTTTVPLGEAPDEPAHLNYARFIAKHGRLPATVEERGEAGYRATWPPLYHLMVAGPAAAVGDAPPTRLKSVGDTPRRLIPTNGQTIASFVHTADETWPWHGVTLAWHLGRFISIALMLLAVVTTYLIAWSLTGQRSIALSAAALHAFIPQVLFVGSVISDGNLLILLSGLIIWVVIYYTKQGNSVNPFQLFWLGLLLGLATITKYNALPLWGVLIAWLAWQSYQEKVGAKRKDRGTRPPPGYPLIAVRLIGLLTGAVITAGWWFIFVWQNFNQVSSQGLLAGSLAALSAGTSDASLRQIAAGSGFSFPAPSAWLAWLATLFKSFWGLFGGGGTIEFPGWIYGLLAVICAIALGSVLVHHADGRFRSRQTERPVPLSFFLLTPLFFLPLPMLRFVLTGSIVETAQGRHLFPAVSIIALILILGVRYFAGLVRRSVSRSPGAIFLFPLLCLSLSVYGLHLIQASYSAPIPLWTTDHAPTVETPIQAELTDSITLAGYSLSQPEQNALPLTLLWQATAIPPEDYLIELTATNGNQELVGTWLGHPIGGRYPTRAWDSGDIIRDDILIPLLSNLPTTPTTVTLTLLTTDQQSAGPALTLATSRSPAVSSSENSPTYVISPPALRADNLPVDAPFGYRSTLSFVLPDLTDAPEIHAPDGQTFSPARFLSGPTGSLTHFVVGANWPSGTYRLETKNGELPDSSASPLTIKNRPRQFDAPPMDHIVDANFADQITLLGYDLPQQRVEPGESFPVTLHLRAERTIGTNLVIFNHLLDAAATQHGGVDRIPKNFYTTLLWVPGEIVADSYQVPVDTTAPPGVYWLDVGLYPTDKPTFSLPLFVNGQPIDQTSVRLGPIKVGGPPPGTTVDQVDLQYPLQITFGDQIELLGFNIEGEQQRKPAIDELNLYWQPLTLPAADYTVFVHIIDDQGNLVAQADGPPVEGSYPTSLWDPGEIIVDRRTMPDLQPGYYTVRMGMYEPVTGRRLPVDGTPEDSVTLLELEAVD